MTATRGRVPSRQHRDSGRSQSLAICICCVMLSAAGGCSRKRSGDARSAQSGSGSVAQQTDVSPMQMRMYPQFGHVYDIWCVAISPDSRYLLSGSRDESVRLWELQTGILLHTFDVGAEVRSVHFSPDGTRAIAGDDRGRITVFDLSGEQKIATFANKKGGIGDGESMGVFPDGKRVVIGHNGNNLHVWDLQSGNLLQALGGDEIRFRNVPNYVRVEADSQAILPDGRLVFGGYQSGKIKLWDVNTGTLVWEIDAHPGPVHSLRVAKDGTYLFSGSTDGLKQWNIAQKQLVRHYSDLNQVWVVNLSPDEKQAWLAVDGSGPFLPRNNRVLLLDLASGRTTSGEGMSARRFSSALSLAPDGSVVAAGDTQGNITLWAGRTGELRQVLRGSNGMLNDVAVSKTGLRIATVAMDKNVYLWDGELIASTAILRGHTSWPNSAVFSPAGNTLLTSARSQDVVRLWDLASNKNILGFDPGGVAKPVRAHAIAFTPDGQRVVTCNFKGEVRIFHLPDGRIVNSYQVGDACDGMSLTTDGRRLLAGLENAVQIYSLESGTPIGKIELPTNGIDEIGVSPDGIHAAVAMPEGVYLLDLETRRLVRTLGTGNHDATAFSADGRYLASANNDRVIEVWDVHTGQTVATYRGHSGDVTSLHFSASGRQLVSAAKDGTTKIWNRENGLAVTLLVRDGEWLAYSDDGYFDASRRGGELAAIVSGFRGFRIDQLAARNNRPDILLDRIGVSNPALKAHFEALYRQRLHKLGLTEDALANVYHKAPEAKLVQLDQRGKQVSVRIAVSDAHYDLVSYNIYANDVPLYGSRGKPLAGRSHMIDERIELTSGRNKIEVSALNRAGVESLRDGRVVSYAPSVQGDLYYLGFGVSAYKDPALTLKYAAKDATDLEAVLRSATGFRHVYTRTYVDAQVTGNAIRQAKDFLKSASVDDTVLLFVAGHGLYGGTSAATYYYVTFDTDIDHIEQTAADFESFENLLQVIAPRRKLFLMDTCQSGDSGSDPLAGGLEEVERKQLRSRGIRIKDARSRISASAVSGLGGERSRYIYNDLFRRSGAIVLSSSRGSEASYERDDLRNGVFTATVLRALTSNDGDVNRDRRLSTDELREYVMRQVPQISSGMQHPVVDRDNLYMLFSLPLMSPIE